MRFFSYVVRWLIGTAQRLLHLCTLGNFPPFATASVVIRQEGKILMIERSDGRGLSLPGGFMRLHETAEAAARREAREETGHEVEITGLVGVLSGRRTGTYVRTVEIVYEGRIAGGSLRPSSEGTCRWVDLQHNRLPIAFDYGELLLNLPIRN